MIMMRARQSFTYDGRKLDAGEVFELCERSVDERRAVSRVLTQGGLAEPYEGDAKPKRRYNRRDLRAEQ